jgi:hypothetical protein
MAKVLGVVLFASDQRGGGVGSQGEDGPFRLKRIDGVEGDPAQT